MTQEPQTIKINVIIYVTQQQHESIGKFYLCIMIQIKHFKISRETNSQNDLILMKLKLMIADQ